MRFVGGYLWPRFWMPHQQKSGNSFMDDIDLRNTDVLYSDFDTITSNLALPRRRIGFWSLYLRVSGWWMYNKGKYLLRILEPIKFLNTHKYGYCLVWRKTYQSFGNTLSAFKLCFALFTFKSVFSKVGHNRNIGGHEL